MGLQPEIKKRGKFVMKQCARCGQSFGPEGYAPTKSSFYPDGVVPLCNDCVDAMIEEHEGDWHFIDKLCQWADIPFVPKEWERLRELATTETFFRYAQVFMASEYNGLDWSEYFKAFKKLRDDNALESELPILGDAQRKKLRERWGSNYDDDALNYLEQLFNGLMSTQNVNGALQLDQAIKICKMSYEIDTRIATGEDFDKLLTAYDKMVKAAEFTPKNAKNINDFDTFGEATKWMEKHGWKNTFYDKVTRDIVDESMQNFQSFNQRLYINESNIGDEITRRLEAIKSTAALEKESYYGTDQSYDLDKYEQRGYNELFGAEDDDFDAEVSDGSNS